MNGARKMENQTKRNESQQRKKKTNNPIDKWACNMHIEQSKSEACSSSAVHSFVNLFLYTIWIYPMFVSPLDIFRIILIACETIPRTFKKMSTFLLPSSRTKKGKFRKIKYAVCEQIPRERWWWVVDLYCVCADIKILCTLLSAASVRNTLNKKKTTKWFVLQPFHPTNCKALLKQNPLKITLCGSYHTNWLQQQGQQQQQKTPDQMSCNAFAFFQNQKM